MKTMLPLARVGAVVSAVALLSGYVYYRATGGLDRRAAAEEKGSVLPGSKRWDGMTIVPAAAPPLVAVQSTELSADIMSSSKSLKVDLLFQGRPNTTVVTQPTAGGPVTLTFHPVASQPTGSTSRPTGSADLVLTDSKWSPVVRPGDGEVVRAGTLTVSKNVPIQPPTVPPPPPVAAAPSSGQADIFPGSKSAPILRPTVPPPPPVAAAPAKLLILAASPPQLATGETGLFSVTVSNGSRDDLENITVTASFEPGLKPTQASAGFKILPGNISWHISKLKPGTGQIFQVQADVPGGPGEWRWSAKASTAGAPQEISSTMQTVVVRAKSASSKPVRPNAQPAQQNSRPSAPSGQNDSTLGVGSKSPGGSLFSEEDIRRAVGRQPAPPAQSGGQTVAPSARTNNAPAPVQRSR
jgi:uncharacterized repeat protein (TIGR01451 family)